MGGSPTSLTEFISYLAAICNKQRCEHGQVSERGAVAPHYGNM